MLRYYRKGNTNDPNNCRGVSLLTKISKIFTCIFNKRLKTWSETHNIHVIGEEQAGFREQHTTIDQLFCLHTIINKYLRHEGGRFYLFIYLFIYII